MICTVSNLSIEVFIAGLPDNQQLVNLVELPCLGVYKKANGDELAHILNAYSIMAAITCTFSSQQIVQQQQPSTTNCTFIKISMNIQRNFDRASQ